MPGIRWNGPRPVTNHLTKEATMSKVMHSSVRRLFVAGKIPARNMPRTLTLLSGETVLTFTVHEPQAEQTAQPPEAA